MPGDSEHVINPSDRTTLMRGPLGAVLLLGGDRTEGRLSVVEHPLEPRVLGSPVHTHRDEDEYSVVLAGLAELFAGQGSPDPGRLAELTDRYGLDLDLASVPRLAAAHGLRVPGLPPGPA